MTIDLTKNKGKIKLTQQHQDNTTKGVKMFDEEEVMVCFMCHKEGHKFYRCKVKNGGEKQKQTSKLSNTYTNKVNKKATTPYLLKKKKTIR
jgi:hypothetical protein